MNSISNNPKRCKKISRTIHKMITLLIFILAGFTTTMYGQSYCSTPEISIHTDRENAFNNFVQKFVVQNRQADTSLRIIPVVIHVIYRNRNDSMEISMKRIMSQIEATNLELRKLNADTVKTRLQFKPVAADCNINVCLARKKPDGTLFQGVIYHYLPDFQISDYPQVVQRTIIKPESYLNVWVIPGKEGGGAVFPWEKTALNDGFWVGAICFGTFGNNLSHFMNEGSTFTHELAHYLGVYHTFHNSNVYLGRCDLAYDGNIGDKCKDTPLDWSFPIATEQCDQGIRFCDDPPDTELLAQTENYMYYNEDCCTNMFSKDQRSRMRACMYEIRKNLVSSSNLAKTGISCAPVNL